MKKPRPTPSPSTEWSATVAASMPLIRRIALTVTHDNERAKDLAQDVALLILEKEARFDGQNLKAWLNRIVRNLYITQYNQQKPMLYAESITDALYERRLPTLRTARNEGQYSYDAELIDSIITERISKPAKPHLEQVVRLRMEGAQYDEIADELGMPVGSVRSTLFRARNLLAGLVGVERA